MKLFADIVHADNNISVPFVHLQKHNTVEYFFDSLLFV